MIFKCKNCGGNSVYSPEKKMMYCPFARARIVKNGNMNMPEYRFARTAAER